MVAMAEIENYALISNGVCIDKTDHNFFGDRQFLIIYAFTGLKG